MGFSTFPSRPVFSTLLRPATFLILLLLLPSLASAGFAGRKARTLPSAASAPAFRGGGLGDDECDAPRRVLSPPDLAIAGALATMIGDVMLHPVDCVKTLQQSSEGAALGFFGAASKILSTQGAGGFYSGLGTYVVADGGAGAIKFAT